MTTPMDEPKARESTQTETPDNTHSDMTPEELQQVVGGQNGCGSGPPAP